MSENVKDYCGKIYNEMYTAERQKLVTAGIENSKSRKLSVQKEAEIETAAQKEAIKQSLISAMKNFKETAASEIWKCVYESHIQRKSGISDSDIINKVISADQSWKKSSGHAFEETIKFLASEALKESGIEIILQRDLSILIKADEVANEPRDISWLKEQIEGDIFDLYAIVQKDGKKYCYGCIQSKTSIRDRVTRDREPSIHAMQSFFWSAIIVLDGEFLKLPKFISMVNGGTSEFPENGWHGLYLFSGKESNGRIYSIDLEFVKFKEHAIRAATYWLSQRQWFNQEWNAEFYESEK